MTIEIEISHELSSSALMVICSTLETGLETYPDHLSWQIVYNQVKLLFVEFLLRVISK